MIISDYHNMHGIIIQTEGWTKVSKQLLCTCHNGFPDYFSYIQFNNWYLGAFMFVKDCFVSLYSLKYMKALVDNIA
jgi:hypothetical protein